CSGPRTGRAWSRSWTRRVPRSGTYSRLSSRQRPIAGAPNVVRSVSARKRPARSFRRTSSMTPNTRTVLARCALVALIAAATIAAPHPVLAQQAPSAGQAVQEPTVTLDQAVELAQQHSPALAQRLGSVTTSRSAERVQVGTWLPNLSFSSGASLSSTERFNPQTNTTVSGSSDSYSAGLSAS